MIPKLYAVPAHVAEELRLTSIRRHDDKGYYLLSGVDLQGYSLQRALDDGAEALTQAEAKIRFCNK